MLRVLALLLAALMTALPLALLGLDAPARAQGVPLAAQRHRAELTRNARAVMGLDAPVPLFAAQIHQESAWRDQVRSLAGAEGLAQFMPATAAWIAQRYPALAANEPFNPSWALRALVTYDAWLFARLRAANACERWAFALSAYNGGLGWVNRDKALATRQGRDALVWFGSVEQVNAGRSAANWRENRGYPARILMVHQPRYVAAGWGEAVCP